MMKVCVESLLFEVAIYRASGLANMQKFDAVNSALEHFVPKHKKVQPKLHRTSPQLCMGSQHGHWEQYRVAVSIYRG